MSGEFDLFGVRDSSPVPRLTWFQLSEIPSSIASLKFFSDLRLLVFQILTSRGRRLENAYQVGARGAALWENVRVNSAEALGLQLA